MTSHHHITQSLHAAALAAASVGVEMGPPSQAELAARVGGVDAGAGADRDDPHERAADGGGGSDDLDPNPVRAGETGWQGPRERFGFTAPTGCETPTTGAPDDTAGSDVAGGEGFHQHIARTHQALDRHRAETEQTGADQARADQLARWHTDDHTGPAAGEPGLGWEPPTAGDQSW